MGTLGCELKLSITSILSTLSTGEGWQTNPNSSNARVAFASFLPGIAMAICKVITGDPKQGQVSIDTLMCDLIKSDVGYQFLDISNIFVQLLSLFFFFHVNNLTKLKKRS